MGKKGTELIDDLKERYNLQGEKVNNGDFWTTKEALEIYLLEKKISSYGINKLALILTIINTLFNSWLISKPAVFNMKNVTKQEQVVTPTVTNTGLIMSECVSTTLVGKSILK